MFLTKLKIIKEIACFFRFLCAKIQDEAGAFPLFHCINQRRRRPHENGWAVLMFKFQHNRRAEFSPAVIERFCTSQAEYHAISIFLLTLESLREKASRACRVEECQQRRKFVRDPSRHTKYIHLFKRDSQKSPNVLRRCDILAF